VGRLKITKKAGKGAIANPTPIIAVIIVASMHFSACW
jgi:hypothetical protein